MLIEMVIKVTLPYDPIWRPLEWAKENCPSYITNALHENDQRDWEYLRIDYFFSDEKDATLFALRWT